MGPTGGTSIKRQSRSLSLTGIIIALAVGVVLPVLLSTAMGIISLSLGEGSGQFVIGVLVISFTVAAIGGIATVTFLLGRRARLARLQTDLLSNVTHELRTPLAAIRMYAQSLQSDQISKDPKRVEESLETIVRETEWLETMIDRLLTWRSATKDRNIPVMKAEPVREAVEEAIGRFTRMTAPGEVDFSVEMESSTPIVHDRQGISAIVLNLLINAYKYTRAEKVISVSLHDRDGKVVIAVEDNGIGIPQRELGRIFDPFYRVDSRLRGKSSGVGLGLAIVRHLVQVHSGEVHVESNEGQGSRFSVCLPVGPPKEPQP